MPQRPCKEPGCPNAAEKGTRCVDHAPAYNREVRAGYKIYRSAKWKMTRRRQLFLEPLCEECEAVATDVHHRRDISAGGEPYAFENLQSLCGSCHSRITQGRQEQQQ